MTLERGREKAEVGSINTSVVAQLNIRTKGGQHSNLKF